MTKIFPFDCIIVTSPDEKSAKLASGFLQRILEKRLNRYYPSQTIRVVSTYDPFGARCGSGGGTLAALEFAHKDETVLVLHAGGDSSRCPTQMILGKAWTSIPCGHHRNPTIWLIDQLQRLHEHAKFPKGVVVVAATDCLATFFEKGQAQIEWNYQYSDESLVLGIAVPAVITTAKNHGVYIMSQEILKNKSLGIEDPLEVWQKPTVEQLRATTEPAPACFDLSRQEEKQAWIDTGIVVFFPKAVETLYELSGGVLSLCTWKGLEAAYQQQKPTDQSLEEFAQSNALKVDLYTDFLHNLSWPKQQPKKKLKEESSPLREILSRLPLKIMVAPQGRFLHLGTTQELVNFVTEGAYPDHSGVIAYISTFFSLQPRYQCWPNPQPLSRNVALQSSFPDKTSIGTSSLVEYSDLASYKSVSIGDNVMLSGWRNPTKDTSPLEIPNNLSVQILSLNESHGTELFAYMVLGMSDGIKTQMKQCTFFGIPILEFLEKTSLSVEQLGWTEGGDEDDTLWTAKVHPKVPAGTSFESTFGWIKELRYGTTRSVTGNASFSKWLSSSRVSLKELHGLANAEAEWTFRTNLESAVLNLQRENFIPHLRSLLKERCHNTPCDLHWMIEMENREAAANELSNLLNVLEEIAREELGKERFDVCGRAFMIASAILADFDSITNQDKDPKVARDIMEYGTVHVNTLRASSTRCVSREEQLRALDNIIEHRKNAMKTDMVDCLAAYSEITERLAFCMNELSIAGGFHKYVDIPNGENITTRKNFSIVKNQWVMAMAPARCDLA